MIEVVWVNLCIVVVFLEIFFFEGDYLDFIEVSIEYFESLKKVYVDIVERCSKIGFDFIEIYGVYGMCYFFLFVLYIFFVLMY